MHKIKERIYGTKQFGLFLVVSTKNKDKRRTRKMVMRSGYIMMEFSPRRYFEIVCWKGGEKIVIPIQEYYSFIGLLKSFYDGFHKEDMFLLDQLNKLVLNPDKVNDYRKQYRSFDMKMEVAYSVIKDNHKEYEGIDIILNDRAVIKIKHYELQELFTYMNRIDVLNYTQGMEINSMLSQLVYDKEITEYEGRSANQKHQLAFT